MLSREASAEHGRWYTRRAPYLREIMDVCSDPRVGEVSWMAAGQLGKSEVLLNVMGYHVDVDPAPMLMVQPTLDLAGIFSKDRIAPMFRDTPVLRGKLADPKSRDSGNAILHKRFPGGQLAVNGANSPAGLASRPIRILLLDEVDRFPESAGTEGDPADLAEKRTETFWNRLILRTSTPTDAESSRIYAAYLEGDQRRYWVPCPACDEMQILEFAHLVWEESDHESTRYACPHCGTLIEEHQKARMLERGEWRAEAPFGGHASFRLSGLYSPWLTWAEAVRRFLRAGKDPERLQVWTNTVEGELWYGESEKLEADPLFARREHYELAPAGVQVVTVGVDVQADRFEWEVVGWGLDEESWSLDYQRLYGDLDEAEVWRRLAEAIRRPIECEDGRRLEVALCAIDSGYRADDVYAWCRRVGRRWAVPVKGQSTHQAPIQAFPRSPSAKHKVYLTPVGTDTAKTVIYGRLGMTERGNGAGWCHFPARDAYDLEYFAQLTGEEAVPVRRRGRLVYEFRQRKGRRVEALDCRVYALAAIRILQAHRGVRLDAQAAPLVPASSPPPHQPRPPEAASELPAADTNSSPARGARPGGWINAPRRGWLRRR